MWTHYCGALLAAAALLFSQESRTADPVVREGKFVWFELSESMEQVARRLGQPALTADFGADFRAWQYQIGLDDHHEYSHYLVFRRSDRSLISISRYFEPERNVDALFPEPESKAYFLQDGAKTPFGVRVRRLTGGRLLIAIGAPRAGQTTSQLVLIRESDLRFFHPWLDEQLKSRGARCLIGDDAQFLSGVVGESDGCRQR